MLPRYEGWQGLGMLGRGCPPRLIIVGLQELFKGLARHLTHLLAQQPSGGRSGECLVGPEIQGQGLQVGVSSHARTPNLVKQEAQQLIQQFFRGRARCESEAEWQDLRNPQK